MMTGASGLRLIALKCEKCGSLLDADKKDMVYYCSNCDSGFELVNEKDELVPVNVDFVLPVRTMDAEVVYCPFWVFDADIEVSSRDAGTTMGSAVGFLKRVVGQNDEEKPIGKFYVPAFETSMNNIKKLGLEFTQNQPDLEMVKKDRIKGCICSSEDAEKIADFIFLSSEAEKPDMMKHISYTLGLSNRRVVGIPFYRTEGSGLVDGIFGLTI